MSDGISTCATCGYLIEPETPMCLCNLGEGAAKEVDSNQSGCDM